MGGSSMMGEITLNIIIILLTHYIVYFRICYLSETKGHSICFVHPACYFLPSSIAFWNGLPANHIIQVFADFDHSYVVTARHYLQPVLVFCFSLLLRTLAFVVLSGNGLNELGYIQAKLLFNIRKCDTCFFHSIM